VDWIGNLAWVCPAADGILKLSWIARVARDRERRERKEVVKVLE